MDFSSAVLKPIWASVESVSGEGNKVTSVLRTAAGNCEEWRNKSYMKRTNTGEHKGRTEVSRLKVMTQCPIILFTQETRVSSDNLRKMSAVECTGEGGGAGLVAKSNPTFATPWTVAHQAPLSMGFPRQEYRSGLPFPSPGDLPDPEIESQSPAFSRQILYHWATRGVCIYLISINVFKGIYKI